MLKFTPKRRLTGGIRLAAHKSDSTGRPIRRGLLPPRLIVSTRQHHGRPALPIVGIGQTVLRGEPIARADATLGADIHAPTSGRVVAIEPHPVPLSAEVAIEDCIVIETDGQDRAAAGIAPVRPADSTEERLRQIASAGIVGLGGAIFPAAAKIRLRSDVPCELLIINGAECEPYISCDDMLMREAPEAILDGARLLRELVGARECIVAIERDKPQAIDAMTAAADSLGFDACRIAELPSVYPAGGERQLVEVLAGVEIPSTAYPGDVGFLCQNVGTAFAVHNYIRHGEPLVSRIVTVTGSAVREPCNVEAMIGTPIADLVAACGGLVSAPARWIHGGSMMGYSLPDDALPITKATNCVIAADATEIHETHEEWPCIRCSECAIVCPARLQPQDLLLAARGGDASALVDLALAECIECGCCDIVCPSHIPLTRILHDAKTLVHELNEQRSFSELSDRRYRQREQRRRDAVIADEGRRDDVKRSLSLADERTETIAAAIERSRKRKTEIDDR